MYSDTLSNSLSPIIKKEIMKFERGPAGDRTRTCRVTDERGYHYTTMAWWKIGMIFIYLNYLGATEAVLYLCTIVCSTKRSVNFRMSFWCPEFSIKDNEKIWQISALESKKWTNKKNKCVFLWYYNLNIITWTIYLMYQIHL